MWGGSDGSEDERADVYLPGQEVVRLLCTRAGENPLRVWNSVTAVVGSANRDKVGRLGALPVLGLLLRSVAVVVSAHELRVDVGRCIVRAREAGIGIRVVLVGTVENVAFRGIGLCERSGIRCKEFARD